MSLLISAALAAASLPQSAETSKIDLQQAFDTATAAANSGECSKAVTLFEALEKDSRIKPGTLPAATIAIRKGRCLIKLGRTGEGETAILAGLPKIESAGADFNLEAEASYIALGAAAYSRWDYAEAQLRYEMALALETGPDRITTLANLAKSTIFESNSASIAYSDEGLGLAASKETDAAKQSQATFHTLRGRALLNLGQTQQAYDELKKALDLSGGLTSRTTLDEVSMRGDLALAALLLGKKEDARRYMAYTGAGRITESPFATAISMSPPDCGEETGLKPDDFAVVEFNIADDGSIGSAQTVFSRGGPAVAAAFARAVSDWYWLPEALAKIPVFYRLATRVELRCSTVGGSAPGIAKPMNDRFLAWAGPLLGLKSTDQSGLIAELRTRVAQSGRDQDPNTRIAAIGMLAYVDPRRNAETVASLEEASGLAKTTKLSTEIINSISILRLLITPFSKISGSKAELTRIRDADFQTLLADPDIQQDALAANTVRLLGARDDMAVLQQVADDARLANHHPLRQVALLALANKSASSGNLDAAQGYFARTGLTEQQCALVGATPTLKRSGANASDFPDEAARYGFEGWVNLEFDITAEGKAADARAVIAYPPFVFVDAAKGMASGIRYESSFRPSGGVACSANRETIRFILRQQ